VGGDARSLAKAAEGAGKRATFVEDAEGAVPIVLEETRAGDVVLVKGSRSIGTEKVVRALVEQRKKRLA
jgi:UDP-N-acetylmuramyl pentapeptide synthase